SRPHPPGSTAPCPVATRLPGGEIALFSSIVTKTFVVSLCRVKRAWAQAVVIISPSSVRAPRHLSHAKSFGKRGWSKGRETPLLSVVTARFVHAGIGFGRNLMSKETPLHAHHGSAA